MFEVGTVYNLYFTEMDRFFEDKDKNKSGMFIKEYDRGYEFEIQGKRQNYREWVGKPAVRLGEVRITECKP